MVDKAIEAVTKKHRLKRVLFMVVGAFIMGYCYNAFILPNHLVYGGLSGFSIFLEAITGIKATLILNVGTYALLVVSLLVVGWKRTSYGLIGFFCYTMAINLTEPLANSFHLTCDSFLLKVLLVAGIEGIGMGLIYKAGFNTAGSDTIIDIFSHFFKKPITNVSTILNGIIILCGFSQFGLTSSVYAFIYLLTINMVADYVLLGNRQHRLCFISGHHLKDMEEYIAKDMNMGYTLINSTNGIGFLNRPIIMLVLPSDRFGILKNKIKSIDKHAHIIAAECYTIEGGKTNHLLKVS